MYRFSHFTVRKRDPQYDDAGLDNPLQLTSWTNTKVELCDDWMCTQVPLLKFAIELDFRYTVAKIRRLPRGSVIGMSRYVYVARTTFFAIAITTMISRSFGPRCNWSL